MPRLTYEQIAEYFLNPMYAQVTGRDAITSIPFGDMQQLFSTGFVSNLDNLYGTLETVIAKTLFAVRPISEPFNGLEWDAQKYGDIVRKLTPITTDALDNHEWLIPEERAKQNPDWKCCSEPVEQDFLAMRVTGGNAYARKWTIYRNQMNAAFQNQQGVSDFFSMMATERANRMKIDRLNEKRSLINNAIIALSDIGGTQVFHALTQYNQETGQTLTGQTVLQAANFRSFMIWFASKIDYLRRMLQDITSLYHVQVTGKEVDRHTPMDKQRLYIHAQFASIFRNNSADIFNPDRMDRFGDYEEINYWQNPRNIYQVTGEGKKLAATGAIADVAETTVNNVIGMLTDVDFMGLSQVDTWTAPEPYNAKFGFQNTWYHNTFRSLTDFTENAILITLD